MVKTNTTIANGTSALTGLDINSTALPDTTDIASTAEALTDLPSDTIFDWNEHQKQTILGSFFWGYILTELPGGRLAELIGGHRVFGHSMLWASVITLITPVTAHMGYVPMVILRALLGFFLGGN